MSTNSQSWQDRSVLRELYVEQELTQSEIGDRLGCDFTTVSKWMKRHKIPARNEQQAAYAAVGVLYAKFETLPTGYEFWRDSHDQLESGEMRVYVHQLLMIAEGTDPHDVFGGELEAHHKNGVPWDNRPENVVALEKAEHARFHQEQDTSRLGAVESATEGGEGR